MEHTTQSANRRRLPAPPFPPAYMRPALETIDFASFTIPLVPARASSPANEETDDDSSPPPQPDPLNILGGILATAVGPPGAGARGRGVGAGSFTVPSDEVAAREDRMAMEEENRALLMDADRLRKWKDRLLHDNKLLREEAKRIKEKLETVEKNLKQETKEKKQLKESYQKVWQEKVQLLEKAMGPAKLPLEILLTIGGFVAGSNNYGTLLALSLASKRIRQEMKPVFFETFIIMDPKDLLTRPEGGGRKSLDAYKYTKFLFSRQDAEPFHIRSIFPNLHLLVYLDTALVAGTSPFKTNEENFHKFAARIFISRPLRTKLLTTLLAYPVNWKTKTAPLYLPVKGLAMITLRNQGALVGEPSQNGVATFRNHYKDVYFKIRDGWDSKGQLTHTIGELNKLGPIALENAGRSTQGSREPLATLNVDIEGESTLNAWIEGLPSLLSIQPHIKIEVDITAQMSRAKFQELTQSAASAYASVWNVFKQDYRTAGTGAPIRIFSMDYPLAGNVEDNDGEEEDWEDDQGEGPPGITLAGRLIYVRSTQSFVAKVVEINDDTFEEEEIFSEVFANMGAHEA